MEITVELPVFDGPLDLLLHLIEKNKINIFDIPIIEITDQYLEFVRKMEREDLGVMSEFMVMAAELISIKCRMLLPAEVDEEGEEIDPRGELVEQLLEYKTYKYMSGELRDRMELAGQSFYKDDTTPPEMKSFRPPVDLNDFLGDLTLRKLHRVFDAVLRRQVNRIDPVRSRFGTIPKEEVKLEDKLVYVAEYAAERRRFSFSELLEGERGRVYVIVTFLAVLELMKYGIIEAVQEEIAGDIIIAAVEGADLSAIDLENDFGGT
ncbi:MAG: segregation/condensation protein A [Lachnospiraceae bacterium]|nr:segregation/condensation protein A [Lachnospiraceae bacterium]